jgi:hypothetical protein
MVQTQRSFHERRVGGFLIVLSMTRFDLLFPPSFRHIRHAFPPSFRHPSAILPPSPVRSLVSMLQ